MWDCRTREERHRVVDHRVRKVPGYRTPVQQRYQQKVYVLSVLTEKREWIKRARKIEEGWAWERGRPWHKAVKYRHRRRAKGTRRFTALPRVDGRGYL